MKTDVKNDICWSKIGSGFVEPGGTSPPRIPRSIPLGHVVSTTNCFQRELTLCWIIQWETTVTLTCCFKHETNYHKILKISPRTYIFQRPCLRGLSTERNLHFKTDWASLIVGSKFTIFALFYFVFEGNFSNTSPLGTYFWRDDLTEGFFVLPVGGLIFGGAYFRNFTVLWWPVGRPITASPPWKHFLWWEVIYIL